jgi:aspartokinase
VKKIKIGGILQGKGLASIRITAIPDRSGVASIIFRTLGSHGINVEFIVHTIDERGCSLLTLCVDRKDLQEALFLVESRRNEICFVDVLDNAKVGLISIFGPHFREQAGIAGIFFHALGEAQINILAISTSVSTCSCLIEEKDMPDAVTALSQAFELPGG